MGAGAGFTTIELLMSVAIVATLMGMAIPLTTSALDEMRTAMAARYLAGRILGARVDALQRSTRVGLRFEPSLPSAAPIGPEIGDIDYTVASYADGNRNGIRTAEILDGTDPLISASEHLSDHFPTVHFGLAAAVPDLDGVRQFDGGDGVRIGSPKILTLSPDGTATSGTLYVRGRQAQYAVRVLGATARTRVFRYQRGANRWVSR